MKRKIIYVVGLQRGGNTWLTHLMMETFKAIQVGRDYSGNTNPPLRNEDGGVYAVKRMHPLFKDYEDVLNHYCIRTKRNPLDIFNSLLYYWNIKDKKDSRYYAKLALVAARMQFEIAFWNIYEPTYTTSYEALKNNGATELQNIYLSIEKKEKPIEYFQAIIDKINLDEMRKRVNKFGIPLVRKGEIGDHKNRFTKEDIDFIYSVLHPDAINEYGYKQDNKKE